jgi:hypothetical protein
LREGAQENAAIRTYHRFPRRNTHIRITVSPKNHISNMR